MDIAVTKQMVEAMRCGADALRSYSSTLEDEKQAKDQTTVGLILRHNIELNRQHADLLDGLVRRCSELLADKSKS